MGCPSTVVLENNLVFSVCTHDPDTGVLTDADSVPSYRIYEDETATPILTGDMAKLDDANTTGFYTELIACTAGNGFEDGKTYTIYIEATVDGDTGGISYGFTVESAGVTAADVADAVWDEVSAGHTDAGKAGEQLWMDVDAVLADTDELQTDDVPGLIGALNDLAAADVNAEVDTALADYDAPTKAELDSGLAGLNDPSAADVAGEVWTYSTRTLTQSAAAVAAAVAGSAIAILRGDTLTAELTGLGSLAGYVSIDFTVKAAKADVDADALVRIRLNASGTGDGLLRLNGSGVSDASKGSIAIDDEDAGDITVTLAAAATASLEVRSGLYYDVQLITATAVSTLTDGDADVTADVTRATS